MGKELKADKKYFKEAVKNWFLPLPQIFLYKKNHH